MKTKKTFKIAGMDCASCAFLLEGEFEDKGIQARCSFAKQELEVVGDISEKEIHETVKKAGYQVAQ